MEMDALNRVGKKVGRPGSAGKVIDFPKTGRKRGSAEGSAVEDRVDLSRRAKIVGRARAAVQQADEVRTTRVNALRALVKGREYPINVREVAEKMVEEHLSELT
jgi:flagellar biosynthesis anti-sigma factor FlgM